MFKHPVPHDEAAETASFRKAFASAMQKADPVCSPPAVKTESTQGLAALVDLGQAEGTPQFIEYCNQQGIDPAASISKLFWSHVQAAVAVATPVVSGQAGGTPSIYATFYQNRESFLQEARLLYAAQSEIELLRGLHKLSLSSWIECDCALRIQIRDRVKSLANFGLLLLLVD